jgi:uncharacterized repeat protein (TIGR02543 family)
VLQNLVAGDYTLTVQLNGDNRLQETDYSNNQTSITFSVIGSLRCTVAFNLNGADGTAPDARTVVEGDVVGELPGVTAPAGWTFLGWFTAETGGTEVTASTVVTSDVTCYALWLKPNCHGIVFAPGEEFAEQSIECQSVEVGKVAKLKPCVFAAPAGKRFAGWRRADTGRRYDDGVMVFNLAGPGAVVVMEAVWDRAGE